jgi:hypothetical protein
MAYLRIGAAMVVIVVWAIVVLGSFIEGRTAPPELSGIMLATVTYLFGTEIKRSVRKRRSEFARRMKPRDDE